MLHRNRYKRPIGFLLLLGMFCFLPIGAIAQIDSGYVDVKNGVLFYRVWGQGKPLVFLNGGPGLASNGYEVYATGIEKNRKVILFDQRGTGQSKLKGKQESIEMSDMIEDLESLRKHLGITKWDVFGHSFGGRYAINYIYESPKSIDRVILSATAKAGKRKVGYFQYFKNPKPENLTSLEIQLYQEVQKEEQRSNPDLEKLYRFNSAMLSRFYVSKPENYYKVADWWLNKANPQIEIYDVKGTDKYVKNKVLKKLRNFTNKVLIIHGVGDFINLSHPFFNHDLFPNSQLKIIQDAGHMMSIDSKEEYFDCINAFLNEK